LTVTNDRLTSSIGRQIDNGGVIDSVMIQATPKGTQAAPTQRGQCYAQLQLMHGGCLACGYVYPGHQPALNEFVEPGPAGGPGAITRVVVAGTVGAGRVIGVVPTGALWRWIYGVGVYGASATVGTRVVRLRFRESGGNIFDKTTALTVTANQSGQFEFAPNITSEQTANLDLATVANESPSPDRALPAGYDLFMTDTAAIDGLDVASSEAQVEEWVVPN